MSKIAEIINAGRSIEKAKTGFTVVEVMSALNWAEDQKFYVQNAMSRLTKSGQAYKLGNTKPVVYSFKLKAADRQAKSAATAAAHAKTPPAATDKSLSPPAAGETAQPDRSSQKQPVLSLEDLAHMEIPLELIGEGVFRRNRELERRIYELETELVEIKRRFDDANKRISEQIRMIEKQNQIIYDQNREPKPTAKLKDAASINWKRRS